MSLLFLALLGVVVAVAVLAFCLRRRSDDHTGEALGLGEGSNLSADPAAAPAQHSAEAGAARSTADDADEA